MKRTTFLHPSDAVKIHHIGSTSINGIWAKPIIDILVEASLRDHEAIKREIVNAYTKIRDRKIDT